MPTDNLTDPIDVLFLRNIRGLEQPSGAEVYLAYLARHLPDFGVHPHFLFSVDPDADHSVCLDLFRDAGISFDLCPVPSALSRADLKAARTAIRERQPDLVHTMDHRSDLVGALLRKMCPVVASFLGWTNFTPGSFRWNVYGTIDRFALAKMDMIFYDSRQMIKNLGALSDAPQLRYVANGIDLDRFRPDGAAFARDHPLTFIQIARFHPNKGQLDFVRAAHAASGQRDGLKFILVGNSGAAEEAYEREVRDYVEQNNLTCVEFTGPVAHSALPALVSRSDVLVAPSYVEGLSIAVLEAMAMERGVICYNTGGLAEALEHGENALIVDTGDVEGLASSMVRLDEDRELGRQLGKSARGLIESSYSISAMAKTVAEGYREVLANSNRASGKKSA